MQQEIEKILDSYWCQKLPDRLSVGKTEAFLRSSLVSIYQKGKISGYEEGLGRLGENMNPVKVWNAALEEVEKGLKITTKCSCKGCNGFMEAHSQILSLLTKLRK